MELIIKDTIVTGLTHSYDEKEIDLVIPEGITHIGNKAFKGQPIASVSFPSTLHRIGFGAFNNTKLTTVEIPDSVTKIDNLAFSECELLRSVKLPKHIKLLAELLFYNCVNLEHVNFPSELTKIGEAAFYSTNLKIVDLSGTQIKKINRDAFLNCRIKDIKLPDTLKELGKRTFQDCTNLEEIEIPGGIEILPENLFCGCHNLKTIKLNFGLKKIQKYALPPNFENLTFPESLKMIDADGISIEKLCKLSIPSKTQLVFELCNITVCSAPAVISNSRLIEENGYILAENREYLLSIPDIPVVNIPNGPKSIYYKNDVQTSIREIITNERTKSVTISSNTLELDRIVINGQIAACTLEHLSVSELVFSPELTDRFVFWFCSSKSNKNLKIFSNSPITFFPYKYASCFPIQSSTGLDLKRAFLTAFFDGGYPYNSETIKFVDRYISLVNCNELLELGPDIIRHTVELNKVSADKARELLTSAADIETRSILIAFLAGTDDDLTL